MGNSVSASSSSTSISSEKFDVFISFRGEDTRNNFTSHLHKALCQNQIDTFIDYRLQKGDEVWSNLSKNIRKSKISVVIFSKDYASSNWCLRELVKIMKCKKKHGQTVIPVFYQVDPSDVRKQEGSFKDSFVEHEKQFQEEVPKWRKALTEASNLTGWDSSLTKPDAKLVENIVRDVEKKLTSGDIWSPSVFKGFTGIGERIEQVMSLLCLYRTDDIRIIGIWGMGGIGKTTIANVIYNKISYQFEGKCFIRDVRGRLERSGGSVFSLQEEFLSKVLGNKENLKLDGTTFSKNIKKMLSKRKVFIVLDDVDDFIKLEELAGGLDRFGSGSRIMITSRNRQVLENCTGNADNIYEVKGLDSPKALEHFCHFAFKKDYPTNDLRVLSIRIVDYAKRNPLALKVLGSSLFRKSKVLWESAIANLQENFKGQIFDVLKISYEGLDDEEKNMFLDIACFFKGEFIKNVTKIYGDSSSHLLSVLEDKSLISVVSQIDMHDLPQEVGREFVLAFGRIDMHDLLQEMGREIVRRESNRPGNRSRLWRQEDVLDTLKNGDGTDAVRGIVLRMDMMVEDIYLSPKTFKKMKSLRFIKFGIDYFSSKSRYEVHCPNGLIYLSNQLRSLEWLRCPLKVLPPNFISNYNLVELDLSYGNLETLGEDMMFVPKLKWLILKNCQHLTSISKRLHAPLLLKIDLENCIELLDFPSIDECSLKQLLELNLMCCKKLKQLPSKIHFESLVSLHLSYNNLETFQEDAMLILKDCQHLKRISKRLHAPLLEKIELQNCVELLEFPSPDEYSLKQLRELKLQNCVKLKQLPSKIHCESLRSLNLGGCINLTRIPDLSKASLLKNLYLIDCVSLIALPRLAQQLQELDVLSLNGCTNITSVSSEIHFGSLESLDLRRCNKLTKFPQFFGNIMVLDMSGTAIDEVPSSIQNLTKLFRFDLSECKRLDHISSGICKLKSLEELIVKDCSKLESFPDILEVMEGLKFLDLSGTTIKELPNSIGNMTRLFELRLRKFLKLEMLPNSIYNLMYLAHLDLSDCSNLKIPWGKLANLKSLIDLSADRVAIRQLPNALTHMNSLVSLSCRGCEGLAFTHFSSLPYSLKKLWLSDCNLQEIPEDFDCLFSLKYLDLSGSDFKRLPESFGKSAVVYLYLDKCHMLQSLTDLPSTIKFLSASDCKQLRSIPDEYKFEVLDKAEFIFSNCLNLEETMFSNILKRVIEENKQKYFRATRISICCPGGEVPRLFNYQSEKSWIEVQLKWSDLEKGKLVGFAVCAVIEFREYQFRCYGKAPLKVLYECRYDYGDENSPNAIMDAFEDGIDGSMTVVSRNETLIDSDHVALGNVVSLLGSAPKREYTTFSFKFWLSEKSLHCRVKSCGVYPIYQDSRENIPRESSVEVHNKIRKFSEEATTSDKFYKVVMEQKFKRICSLRKPNS